MSKKLGPVMLCGGGKTWIHDHKDKFGVLVPGRYCTGLRDVFSAYYNTMTGEIVKDPHAPTIFPIAQLCSACVQTALDGETAPLDKRLSTEASALVPLPPAPSANQLRFGERMGDILWCGTRIQGTKTTPTRLCGNKRGVFAPFIRSSDGTTVKNPYGLSDAKRRAHPMTQRCGDCATKARKKATAARNRALKGAAKRLLMIKECAESIERVPSQPHFDDVDLSL
jgi:hypothetical protein